MVAASIFSALGDVRVVLGEGMPFYKSPFEKGRLIIKFSVSLNVVQFLLMFFFLCYWEERGKQVTQMSFLLVQQQVLWTSKTLLCSAWRLW